MNTLKIVIVISANNAVCWMEFFSKAAIKVESTVIRVAFSL